MMKRRTALAVMGAAVGILSVGKAQVTTSSLASANLVRNASFEDGLAAWAGDGMARATLEARDGLYALTISGERTQEVRLEPGERYELRAWGQGDGTVRLGDATLTFDALEMQEKRLTFTAPDGGEARLVLRAGVDFVVDFVQLYPLAELTALAQAWTATAGAAQAKGSVQLTTEAYRQGTGKPSPTVSVTQPTTRDPWLWPFARDSIWNTPIGSGAVYVPANLEPAEHFAFDQDLLFVVPAAAPWRDVHPPGNWGEGRCSKADESNFRGRIRLPDALYIADATAEPYQTPNNAVALLQGDERTLVQLEPFTRCVRGGRAFGYRATDGDLYGDGLWGGHFGSGLSSIGGTLRQGELLGSGPVRHALKLKVWGKKYLSYDAESLTPGFRWPAIRADSGAGDPAAFNAYAQLEPALSNPVEGLVMGSLLAIPSEVTFESLNIDPNLALYPVVEKLFHTLQDYGGYIDDNTGWDAHYFGAEYGVEEELALVYGSGLETGGPEVLEAVNKLFTALHVVDNNGPEHVGGGGTPRTPLAPPFAEPAPPLQTKALDRTGWQADAFAAEGGHPASAMLDDDPATAWRSGRPQDSYQDVIFDLGRPATFSRLVMTSGAQGSGTYGSWARDFTLEVSPDGETWTVVAATAGAPVTALSFPPQTARYLHLTEMNAAEADWAVSDLKLYR